MLIYLILNTKSESDLFLYTRNLSNGCLDPVWVQNHLLNLCSRGVNSQRLCSQKAGVLKLSGIKKN